MASKLFKFVEQFMKNTFLIKLTPFEKTGSIGIFLISLGHFIINLHFCCSIVEFAFLLTMEMH